MKNLFYSRELSLEWVKNDFRDEYFCVSQGFDFLSEMIQFYEKIIEYEEKDNETKTFLRISGIILSSYNHYLLGTLSLCLDALGHEAGALLRPAIEAYELLVYIQQDSERISQVIEEKLPSSGKIAQIISGDFQDLRDYYNKNTSHFSARSESIKHLIKADGKIATLPTQKKGVLFVNLAMINAFQIFMLTQSINDYVSKKIGSETIIKFDLWIENSKKLFPVRKF